MIFFGGLVVADNDADTDTDDDDYTDADADDDDDDNEGDSIRYQIKSFFMSLLDSTATKNHHFWDDPTLAGS